MFPLRAALARVLISLSTMKRLSPSSGISRRHFSTPLNGIKRLGVLAHSSHNNGTAENDGIPE